MSAVKFNNLPHGYCQVGWLYYGFKIDVRKLWNVIPNNKFIQSLKVDDDTDEVEEDDEYDGDIFDDLTKAAKYLTKHYPLPAPYTYQSSVELHENTICVGIEILALDDKIPHHWIVPNHIRNVLPQGIPEGLNKDWLKKTVPDFHLLQPDCGCCS